MIRAVHASAPPSLPAYNARRRRASLSRSRPPHSFEDINSEKRAMKPSRRKWAELYLLALNKIARARWLAQSGISLRAPGIIACRSRAHAPVIKPRHFRADGHDYQMPVKIDLGLVFNAWNAPSVARALRRCRRCVLRGPLESGIVADLVRCPLQRHGACRRAADRAAQQMTASTTSCEMASHISGARGVSRAPTARRTSRSDRRRTGSPTSDSDARDGRVSRRQCELRKRRQVRECFAERKWSALGTRTRTSQARLSSCTNVMRVCCVINRDMRRSSAAALAVQPLRIGTMNKRAS